MGIVDHIIRTMNHQKQDQQGEIVISVFSTTFAFGRIEFRR